MNRTRKPSRKRKNRISLPVLAVAVVLLLALLLLLTKCKPESEPEPEIVEETTEETVLETTMNPYLCDTPAERLIIFARENGLSMEEWPQEMLTLLEKNPDAEEYVQNYPLLKDTEQPIDLSDLVGTGEVPLLLQWDARWGYTKYGSGPMGLTACGPTCLSMVSLYFLEDAKYTPRYVADYAQENGHYARGAGTSWTLMSKGAKDFGLNVDTISPTKSVIMNNLEAGYLIICAMGPGIFTDFGHFILLAGAKDGKAIVHDPNSTTNSAKLWDVAEFKNEISMLWVYKPIEE